MARTDMGWFLSGILIGAGIGLLFAPKPGAQTRQLVNERVQGVRARVTDAVRRRRGMMNGEESMERMAEEAA